MIKKLTPEIKSEHKWLEQFGDEDLNSEWNKMYTNRL